MASTHKPPKGEGWITSPDVLDMIFLMKAMQDGDEVWLSDNYRVTSHWHNRPLGLWGVPDYNADGTHVWGWCRVVGSPEKSYDGSPVPDRGATGFHMRRDSIVAWRRPLTPKHKEEG